MSLFDRVVDLPVTVESVSRDRFESDTSSGFLRKTTVFSLAGDGAVGRGEDVTYDTEDHDAPVRRQHPSREPAVGRPRRTARRPRPRLRVQTRPDN